MNRFLYLFSFSTLAIVIAFAGCSPTATSDSQAAAPKMTFKDTLEKTSKLAAKLNQGFEDGAGHGVVHDPLHEISHLLDALPNQIAASDLSEENKTELTSNVNTLMDNYGKIDAKFHGGEGAEYADVKDNITKALSSFDSIFKSLE